MKIRNIIAASAIAVAMTPLAAHADLSISYFTIGTIDQDANVMSGGNYDNYVQNTLGANGLPVLNTATYGCVSNCLNVARPPFDVLASGEITWWSPANNANVTLTQTTTTTLPFNVPSNFFPPNGTGGGNGNGFQAAKIFGTLNAPTLSTIAFSIAADDMAFAFLDGQKVCDLGGIHPYSVGTCVTPFDIAAGDHLLEVFFVDLNFSQSGFLFGIQTTGVTTNPNTPGTPAGVPEPLTVSVFGAGLAVAMRRRRSAK
jgi:hypothetical protein